MEGLGLGCGFSVLKRRCSVNGRRRGGGGLRIHHTKVENKREAEQASWKARKTLVVASVLSRFGMARMRCGVAGSDLGEIQHTRGSKSNGCNMLRSAGCMISSGRVFVIITRAQ